MNSGQKSNHSDLCWRLDDKYRTNNRIHYHSFGSGFGSYALNKNTSRWASYRQVMYRMWDIISPWFIIPPKWSSNFVYCGSRIWRLFLFVPFLLQGTSVTDTVNSLSPCTPLLPETKGCGPSRLQERTLCPSMLCVVACYQLYKRSKRVMLQLCYYTPRKPHSQEITPLRLPNGRTILKFQMWNPG